MILLGYLRVALIQMALINKIKFYVNVLCNCQVKERETQQEKEVRNVFILEMLLVVIVW